MADQFMDSMKKIHPYHIERLQYMYFTYLLYEFLYLIFV